MERIPCTFERSSLRIRTCTRLNAGGTSIPKSLSSCCAAGATVNENDLANYVWVIYNIMVKYLQRLYGLSHFQQICTIDCIVRQIEFLGALPSIDTIHCICFAPF